MRQVGKTLPLDWPARPVCLRIKRHFMKILAIEHETPGLTGADFAPHLKAEAQQIWDLTQAGLIREIYFCYERSAAVIILECQDLDHARQVLASLPLVENGLITFELLALSAYPGYARLFAHPSQRGAPANRAA